MPVNINADTVVGGAVVTADASGVLALQASGNTALTINASGAIGVGSSPSYGTSGQVLTSAGTGAAPTWSTPSSASLSEFTSSGTWTKPSGANFVMVEAWGAGGGGGSGRRGATGSAVFGGAGAGGGAYAYRLFKAADLTSTVTVTVGAGGSGGAAVTANDTNGNNGTTGGDTTFGSYLTAYGGNLGQQGTTAASNSGLGGGVLSNTAPQALVPSGTTSGHFGAGASSSSGASSGFGGGGGGNGGSSSASSAGNSYQGGPGGGGATGFSSAGVSAVTGSGGGISGSGSTGAVGVAYPGATGNAGSGRQGGSGGAGGYAAADAVSTSAIAFGNSTFAVATTSGKVLTSSNGTNNWVYVATPSNLAIYQLVHDGSKFVLFNSTASRCWTTTDFVTYTEKTGISSSPAISSFYRVKYQNSVYFVCANSGLYSSTDLNSWTLRSTGLDVVYDICWSGTNYVAVYDVTPYVRYSSDLTTWSTPTGNVAAYQAVSNGSGTVVLAIAASPYARRSTDNGVTFTDVVTTLGQSYDTVLGFANSTYFLSDSGYNLWTSTDGTNWTSRVVSGPSPTTGLAYDGTTYAIGINLSSTSIARTSTPAALGTWTSRSITARNVAGGAGGAGGQPGGGGGGGGGAANGSNSGAGGAGGAGLVRVYTW